MAVVAVPFVLGDAPAVCLIDVVEVDDEYHWMREIMMGGERD